MTIIKTVLRAGAVLLTATAISVSAASLLPQAADANDGREVRGGKSFKDGGGRRFRGRGDGYKRGFRDGKRFGARRFGKGRNFYRGRGFRRGFRGYRRGFRGFRNFGYRYGFGVGYGFPYWGPSYGGVHFHQGPIGNPYWAYGGFYGYRGFYGPFGAYGPYAGGINSTYVTVAGSRGGGNALAGTLAGAAIGGFAGAAIDGGHNRTAGAVIGAVSGAVIGNRLVQDDVPVSAARYRGFDVNPGGAYTPNSAVTIPAQRPVERICLTYRYEAGEYRCVEWGIPDDR